MDFFYTEPPIKKRRGRPRKTPETPTEKKAKLEAKAAKARAEQRKKQETLEALENTNRKSGRMSLRPNVKVKLEKIEFSDEEEEFGKSNLPRPK